MVKLPKHNFGFDIRTVRSNLPKREKIDFTASKPADLIKIRAHIKRENAKQRAHVKKYAEAYKNYDTNFANFRKMNDEFKRAANRFKRPLPEVSKFFQDQVQDYKRAEIKGKVSIEKLNSAASKLYHGTVAGNDKLKGRDTTHNEPYKYNPTLYDNLLEKAALKKYKIPYKKDKKTGKIKPDYSSYSDSEKKKLRKDVKNFKRRQFRGEAPNERLIVQIMELWHQLYGTHKYEPGSDDIMDEYESLFMDNNDHETDQHTVPTPEQIAKVHDELVGVF